MSMRVTSPLALLLLGACNTAPVLPSEDDRVIELVENALWSGGEVRAVIRYAASEEAPLTITLDAEPLTVSRVDDTTFSATLPVHTGPMVLRATREGLASLETGVALHGFLSEVIGAEVPGFLAVRPGAVTHALGAVAGGVVEVSLETGRIGATWSSDVHAMECSNGIAPGPEVGTVLLRPKAEDDTCLPYTIRHYGASGLAPAVAQTLWQPPGYGLSAIVGPTTFIVPWEDDYAWYSKCEPAPNWTSCTLGWRSDPPSHHSVEGWVAAYKARRIVSLSVRAWLHDSRTGAMIGALTTGASINFRVTGAVFSPSEDTLVFAARRVGLPDHGSVALHDAATGQQLANIPVSDGAPLAIALDPGSGRLLAVIGNALTDEFWLRVYSPALEVEADLPIPASAFRERFQHYGHHLLMFDQLRSEAVLVSTADSYQRSTPDEFDPMTIHRWTLP